jgi:predicted dehydrogenase
VPDYSLDEPTTRLFGASLLASYELPGEAIDRKLLALELEDFGRAILDRRPPEVDGQGGLDAVAAIYAFFESSTAGRELSFADVASGAADAYQRDIDVALGLAEQQVPS